MANDELAFIARIIIADEICVDEDEKTLDSVKETQWPRPKKARQVWSAIESILIVLLFLDVNDTDDKKIWPTRCYEKF